MIKRHRYRAYPNQSQEQYFQQVFGACRFVYNWALDLKIKSYEAEKSAGSEKPKGLSVFDISKKLTDLKKQEEFAWLNEMPSVALNWSLQHLDVAYKNFFRSVKSGSQSGFPKFKSKFKSQKAFSFHQGYSVDQFAQWTTVPKRKDKLKLVVHRHFKGDYKTATVIQEPSGKYYLSLVVDDKKLPKETCPVDEKMMVGIDVGIINTITLSDGYQIKLNLDFVREEKILLKSARSLSRKTHKSRNFQKAKLVLAKKHEKIRHKRKFMIENACVNLVSYLLDNGYTGVAMRKYDIKSMVDRDKVEKDVQDKNRAKKGSRYIKRKLNKKIMGGAMGMICVQIKQKVSESGLNIIEFSASETKTTKKCFVCKSEYVNIDLKDRVMNCKECGNEDDIDYNASKNVLEFGINTLEKPGGKLKPVV